MSGECLAAWRGRLLVARYCGLRTNVRIAPRYGLSLRETTEVQMIAMLQHRQHFYSVATVCNRCNAVIAIQGSSQKTDRKVR